MYLKIRDSKSQCWVYVHNVTRMTVGDTRVFHNQTELDKYIRSNVSDLVIVEKNEQMLNNPIILRSLTAVMDFGDNKPSKAFKVLFSSEACLCNDDGRTVEVFTLLNKKDQQKVEEVSES